MHLIDNVDFIFSLSGGISNFITDLTNIIHTIVGCGVNLYDIHRSTGSNRPAGCTLPAGVTVHRVFAVDRFRKNLCHGCFTGTSGAAEQISMSDPVRHNLIF